MAGSIYLTLSAFNSIFNNHKHHYGYVNFEPSVMSNPNHQHNGPNAFSNIDTSAPV